MSRDDIIIRIRPDGRIVFDMTGMTQEQIRLQRELAEEMIGPILDTTPGDPSPPPGVAADRLEERDDKLRRRR